MIVRRLDTSILGKGPIDGEDRLHHFGPAWPWLSGEVYRWEQVVQEVVAKGRHHHWQVVLLHIPGH